MSDDFQMLRCRLITGKYLSEFYTHPPTSLQCTTSNTPFQCKLSFSDCLDESHSQTKYCHVAKHLYRLFNPTPNPVHKKRSRCTSLFCYDSIGDSKQFPYHSLVRSAHTLNSSSTRISCHLDQLIRWDTIFPSIVQHAKCLFSNIFSKRRSIIRLFITHSNFLMNYHHPSLSASRHTSWYPT